MLDRFVDGAARGALVLAGVAVWTGARLATHQLYLHARRAGSSRSRARLRALAHLAVLAALAWGMSVELDWPATPVHAEARLGLLLTLVGSACAAGLLGAEAQLQTDAETARPLRLAGRAETTGTHPVAAAAAATTAAPAPARPQPPEAECA